MYEQTVQPANKANMAKNTVIYVLTTWCCKEKPNLSAKNAAVPDAASHSAERTVCALHNVNLNACFSGLNGVHVWEIALARQLSAT